MTKPRLRPALACALIASILYSTAPATHAAPNLDFNDEELFRGIYFAEGVVAAELETILTTANEIDRLMRAYLPPEAYREAVLAREVVWQELVDWIVADDPGFMSSFGDKIRSGDHLVVQEGLEEGAAHLLAAISALYGDIVEAARNGEQEACVAFLSIVVAVVALVFFGAVAQVTIGVQAVATVQAVNSVIHANVNEVVPFSAVGDRTLYQTALIHEIATRLVS